VAIEKEPTIRETQTRNDVRLVTGATCPLPPVKIDVSTVAVSNKMAPASRRDTSTPEGDFAQIYSPSYENR